MDLIMLLRSLFSRKPKPYYERARHPCPFYGFNGMYGRLMDQNGNQCALLRESHSPCQMEVEGNTPNWENCPFNNDLSRRDIEREAPKVRAFPKEFWPPGKESYMTRRYQIQR